MTLASPPYKCGACGHETNHDFDNDVHRAIATLYCKKCNKVIQIVISKKGLGGKLEFAVEPCKHCIALIESNPELKSPLKGDCEFYHGQVCPECGEKNIKLKQVEQKKLDPLDEKPLTEVLSSHINGLFDKNKTDK